MNIDLEQFRTTYINESLELLSEMEEKLLEIENGDDDVELFHAIFRCVHSIKGGAGAFGLDQITRFTHEFEFFLDHLREGKLHIDEQVMEILFKGRDIVEQMVVAAQSSTKLPENFGHDVAEKIAKINQTQSGGTASAASAKPKEPEKPAPLPGMEEVNIYSIRFVPHEDLFSTGNEPMLLFKELERMGQLRVQCRTDKLPDLEHLEPEHCYLWWEIDLDTTASEGAVKEVFEFVEDACDLEVLLIGGYALPASVAPKPQPQEDKSAVAVVKKTAPEGDTEAPVAKAQAAATIRVDLDKIDRLVNMVGELVITQGMLHMQAQRIPRDAYPEILLGVEELAQHTRELQEAVMAVRMQPVKSIFSRMPRIVRDLSKKLGKNIRLDMSGENTEVDKTIIEQLSDPLTHMIRNSIDHGIESPEKRRERGKHEQGRIHLSAASVGGRIEICIEDDGGGVNRERVRELAVKRGLIAESANLTPEEIDHLIFAPGFSTAEKVTDVSGRGVGMDVVRKNIEGIGGAVAIESTPGKGSRFVISLPLTLAILDGMAVRCGREQYIIPIANIIETMRPAASSLSHLATGIDVIDVRGEFIPLVYLYQMFAVSGTEKNASRALVVLVENGKEKFGIVVDELIGQQQVVIKSLEQNSDPVEGISGATILGDGKVSLILDTVALYRIGIAASREYVQSLKASA